MTTGGGAGVATAASGRGAGLRRVAGRRLRPPARDPGRLVRLDPSDQRPVADDFPAAAQPDGRRRPRSSTTLDADDHPAAGQHDEVGAAGAGRRPGDQSEPGTADGRSGAGDGKGHLSAISARRTRGTPGRPVLARRCSWRRAVLCGMKVVPASMVSSTVSAVAELRGRDRHLAHNRLLVGQRRTGRCTCSPMRDGDGLRRTGCRSGRPSSCR